MNIETSQLALDEHSPCEVCERASGVLEMCEAGGALYVAFLTAIAEREGFSPREFASVRERG